MGSSGGLVSCRRCSRHVRVGEESCPFCGALGVPSSLPAARSSMATGRSPGAERAVGAGAQVARAALLASALVACDAPAVNAAYGGPPPFAQLDGGDDASSVVVPSPTSPVPVDPNVSAAAYGGPPPFLQAPPLAATDAEAPAVLTLAPDAGARKKHPR